MKLRKSLYLSVIFGLILSAGFTSCSSDDSDYVDYSGSKVTLPKTRAFVLNEGSYKGNNSTLEVFNFLQDTICNKAIYLSQNGTKIGDTGEDLITDGENLYMLVYGSSYMAKMNGAGMKTASYTFTSTQGQPRKAIVNGDYLYVTTYGGYVLKFTKSDLKYVASCQVAANPENIVYYDGKLYVICNGYGKLSLMDVIDESTFTEIGGSTSMAIKDDVLYIVNCVTNWKTYATTTSFYSYNISTGKTDTSSFLKNVPTVLTNTSVYSFDINPYDGSFYLGTTDYATEGNIYHFASDGTYKTTFASGGVSPSHIVFMR